MPSPEQSLAVAIGELRCIEPTSPSTQADLRALTLARRAVDDLVIFAIADLRAENVSWAAIAETMDAPSAGSVRKQYHRTLPGILRVDGPRTTTVRE